MPVFSRVLILKSGKVLASGPKSGVLNSKLLSQAFDAPVRLRQTKGRYTLSVEPKTRVVI